MQFISLSVPVLLLTTSQLESKADNNKKESITKDDGIYYFIIYKIE